MIKLLEEQELDILLGEKIFDQEKIMYGISSEDENSSDKEYVFMMTDQPNFLSSSYLDPPEEEKESIKLRGVI